MEDITLLSQIQVSQLDVLKKYGRIATLTDYAVILGGYYKYSTSASGLKKLSYYSTTSPSYSPDKSKFYCINEKGDTEILEVKSTNIPVRPIIVNADFTKIKIVSTENGVLEVEYNGYEYPQTVVSKELSEKLTVLNNTNQLKYIRKSYFNTWPEQEYQGERYIRVMATDVGNSVILSDGIEYLKTEYIWLKVEPIRWLVDEKTGILISKDCLFAGVALNYLDYCGDFENTHMKEYLNKTFTKDITPSSPTVITEKVDNSKPKPIIIRKRNPYDFTFDNVTEEQIIKGSVESGVAVFLHGRSSEGKSARVKQLDPDCVIVDMGTIILEGLIGMIGRDYENKETVLIEPWWYKEICKKCEEEPGKIHILFFDEVTNALPSLQKLVYGIILDRNLINSGFKLSLPKNCRVVASGNEMTDSIAANQLAEPLYNRFAHVYIETTVESWLKWASTADGPKEKVKYEEVDNPVKEHTIHPAVFAFIAYKREVVLRTKYTGEKPNADPRKWELASRILYKTKNPNMLRSLVGEEITKEFCAFCKQQVITLQNVIEGNYTDQEIENMNIAEKHAVTSALTCVDEENVEKVREFVLKLGSEFASIFDSFWTQNIARRLEIIAELRSAQTSKTDSEPSATEPKVLRRTSQSSIISPPSKPIIVNR